MTTAPARPHTAPRLRPVHTVRPALPNVPWRHDLLFREARYPDGQPYQDTADDDPEDDD